MLPLHCQTFSGDVQWRWCLSFSQPAIRSSRQLLTHLACGAFQPLGGQKQDNRSQRLSRTHRGETGKDPFIMFKCDAHRKKAENRSFRFVADVQSGGNGKKDERDKQPTSKTRKV